MWAWSLVARAALTLLIFFGTSANRKPRYPAANQPWSALASADDGSHRRVKDESEQAQDPNEPAEQMRRSDSCIDQLTASSDVGWLAILSTTLTRCSNVFRSTRSVE